VYSFGRAALLLLVEVQNHTVPVRERGRIRVNEVEWDDISLNLYALERDKWRNPVITLYLTFCFFKTLHFHDELWNY
jgi:hypothetical protein